MEQCSQCVLPGTYPNIKLNSRGVCNLCENYRSPAYLGKEKLDQLVSETKKRGSYDCLVPWSGGKDSTYVLLNLVSAYGAKVLAYNYDNGFMSETARENIERISSLLKLEVHRERVPGEVHKKYLKELILLNIGKSLEHLMFSLCSPCRLCIWGGANKIAVEKGIPLIVFGESRMESGYAKKIFAARLEPSRLEKIRSAITKPGNFGRRRLQLNKLKRHFSCANGKVQQINFFDYIPWDEKHIVQEISSKLNWEPERGLDIWRFDCMIHVLVSYLSYRLYGFSEKEELCSKMINEKMLSRSEAQQRIKRTDQAISFERMIIKQMLNDLEINEKITAKILG